MINLSNLGYKQSPPDDRDLKLNVNLSIPKTFSIPRLKIIDQGNQPHCAAASIATVLSALNRKADHVELFKILCGTVDGIILRDAFKIMKADAKITKYYRLGSEINIKSGIMLFGGVIIGLRCYNDSAVFWKGSQLLGGHAVTLTGWEKDGFILQNSWGTSWGKNGITIFPFSDINHIREAWAIHVI